MSSMDIRTIPTSTPSAGARPSMHPHHSASHDYSRNPMLVYWEMTQACGLACRHCRAEAVSTAHPDELTYEEGKKLLHQIAAFDKPSPHLVFTGGDPLRRADLFDLIDEARALGINVSITPSATADLTIEVLAKLKAHGVDSFGLSLDGSTAARHEAVRGVEGCFDWTIAAAKAAATLGVPIQINTLVSQETVDDLPAVYELLKKEFPVMRWSLFFLIEVGRGKVLQPISSERGEQLMNWIYRSLQNGAVCRRDHRSTILSPRRAESHASGRYGRCRDRAHPRLSRLRHSRRAWHYVHLQPGRHLPRRLPSTRDGECASRSVSRRVSQCSNVPGASQPQPLQRQMRALRISRPLRWLACPFVCCDRRSAGKRSVLPLRTRSSLRCWRHRPAQ